MADIDGLGHVEVAAGAGSTVLGATGAYNDYIHRLILVPATTAPGAVTVKDGNGAAITYYTGGTVGADLRPIEINIQSRAVNKTTPGWRITTGANVSVIAIGRFT